MRARRRLRSTDNYGFKCFAFSSQSSIRMIFLAVFLTLICEGWAEDPVPLGSLLNRDYGSEYPREGGVRSEFELVVSGADGPATGSLVLFTDREALNKEFYVRADWPHGQKPILETIRQRGRWEVAGQRRYWSAWTEASFFGRSPKLIVSIMNGGEMAFREFQMWRNQPVEKYYSPVDGEGSGERPVRMLPDTWFEEELPLVLAGMDFEDGQSAVFRLFPPLDKAKAPEIRANEAYLQVREGNKGWIVDVEVADGRRIQYLFSGPSPRVLHAIEHSDGWKAELVASETGLPPGF